MPDKHECRENILVMPVSEKDFDEIWRIFYSVISKGDTYVNCADTTKQDAFDKWMNPLATTFVAKINDEVVGAYLLKPNHVGRGSHVANASYIVDENIRGFGVGKTLALHSIKTAKSLGYKAMQFNFVVSTNEPAVKLWQSVGFRIVATLPKVFNHATFGYVDAYVMFREL